MDRRCLLLFPLGSTVAGPVIVKPDWTGSELSHQKLNWQRHRIERVAETQFARLDTAVKCLARTGQWRAHIYLNPEEKGFGNSIKEGIKRAKGEFVCIFMADQSDDPKDIIKYFEYMNSGLYDCIFGDRWTKDQNVKDYPKIKFFFNRFGFRQDR